MKIKVLMAALFGLITVTAFAQKGELSNAQSAYEKYDGLARANYAIAKPSLTEAKTAIDKAAAKGAKDSLILFKDMAFIVNVKNRTIVTAMDSSSMQDNVFTQIDSAVVIT